VPWSEEFHSFVFLLNPALLGSKNLQLALDQDTAGTSSQVEAVLLCLACCPARAKAHVKRD